MPKNSVYDVEAYKKGEKKKKKTNAELLIQLLVKHEIEFFTLINCIPSFDWK